MPCLKLNIGQQMHNQELACDSELIIFALRAPYTRYGCLFFK